MAVGLSGSLSACFIYIFALLCVSTEWQIKMLACLLACLPTQNLVAVRHYDAWAYAGLKICGRGSLAPLGLGSCMNLLKHVPSSYKCYNVTVGQTSMKENHWKKKLKDA